MQRATDFHHQITHAVFPQPDGIFDDPAAFDAADHVFDRDPSPGNRLIGGLLRIGQCPAFRLAGGTGMDDIRQGITHKTQVIHQLAAWGQRVGNIIGYRFIMHAAFVRIAQKLHQPISGRQDQVFDRVALFLAAVIVGLITCVRGARDGAFGTVVNKGDAPGASPSARALIKASSRSWSVAAVRVGRSPLVASAVGSAVNKTCNQRLAFGWVNPNAVAWAVCKGAPLRYIKTNNNRSSGVGNGQLAYWL